MPILIFVIIFSIIGFILGFVVGRNLWPKTNTTNNRVYNADAIDAIIASSRRSHELHRISYGKAMHGQAINETVKALKKVANRYVDTEDEHYKDFIEAIIERDINPINK